MTKHNEFEERVIKEQNNLIYKYNLERKKGSFTLSFIDVKMQERLNKQLREAIREAQIPESRISQLRQWINEKPKDRLVTNEDIKVWLEL